MTSQQTGHVQLNSCFIKPLKYLQAANLYPWVSFISRLVTQIYTLYMHIWEVHYTYINFSKLGNLGFAKKISFKHFYWLCIYLLSSWQCFVKLNLYSPYDLFIFPNIYVNDYRSFICNCQTLEMTWRSFSWQTGDRLWYNHTVEFCWARGRSTPWNKQVWMSLCVYCAEWKRPYVVSPPYWGSLSMDTKCPLYDITVHEGFQHPQIWYLPASWGCFPGGSVVKNPPANAGDTRDVGSIPGSGKSPGRGNSNPLQYSWRKSHGQSSLVGYRPWGHRESDLIEHTHIHRGSWGQSPVDTKWDCMQSHLHDILE